MSRVHGSPVLVVPTVVGAVLLTGLAACGARPYADFEPDVAAGGARPDVTFTATVTPTADRLVIAYRLENSGPVAVVAYNGMQAPGRPAGVSGRDDVFVTARRDGTVEVAKRAYPVPDGVDPDGAELLRGAVLAPGARLAEKVTVGLPLTGRRPYLRTVKLPPSPYDVVFCLGVARLDALAAPVPRPSGEADADTRPLFPHPSPQHLFCSDPVAAVAADDAATGDPSHPTAAEKPRLLAGNLRHAAR